MGRHAIDNLKRLIVHQLKLIEIPDGRGEIITERLLKLDLFLHILSGEELIGLLVFGLCLLDVCLDQLLDLSFWQSGLL